MLGYFLIGLIIFSLIYAIWGEIDLNKRIEECKCPECNVNFMIFAKIHSVAFVQCPKCGLHNQYVSRYTIKDFEKRYNNGI
jgi:Zn ribbon nucleic-acid-binding protein